MDLCLEGDPLFEVVKFELGAALTFVGLSFGSQGLDFLFQSDHLRLANLDLPDTAHSTETTQCLRMGFCHMNKHTGRRRNELHAKEHIETRASNSSMLPHMHEDPS